MDLNALYFHHQTAVMRRDRAPSALIARSHFDLASHYAKRIGAERSRLGFAGHEWSEPLLDARGYDGAAMTALAS